jgi:hypothetical protein
MRTLKQLQDVRHLKPLLASCGPATHACPPDMTYRRHTVYPLGSHGVIECSKTQYIVTLLDCQMENYHLKATFLTVFLVDKPTCHVKRLSDLQDFE